MSGVDERKILLDIIAVQEEGGIKGDNYIAGELGEEEKQENTEKLEGRESCWF